MRGEVCTHTQVHAIAPADKVSLLSNFLSVAKIYKEQMREQFCVPMTCLAQLCSTSYLSALAVQLDLPPIQASLARLVPAEISMELPVLDPTLYPTLTHTPCSPTKLEIPGGAFLPSIYNLHRSTHQNGNSPTSQTNSITAVRPQKEQSNQCCARFPDRACCSTEPSLAIDPVKEQGGYLKDALPFKNRALFIMGPIAIALACSQYF